MVYFVAYFEFDFDFDLVIYFVLDFSVVYFAIDFSLAIASITDSTLEKRKCHGCPFLLLIR